MQIVAGKNTLNEKMVKIVNAIQLNIGDDGSGYGFVEVTANGVDISGSSQVTKGTIITIQAYVQNPSVAKFNGWSDPGGVLVPYSLTYQGPITITVNSNINLTATFIKIAQPPPPSGPSFPAPGTKGDGDEWYWVQYLDGSVGWADTSDIYYSDPRPTILNGPYQSGAIS